MKKVTVIIPLSPGGGAYPKLDLQERGLIQKSGKYVAKESKKRLELLKEELDKMAIKLNYIELDIGVIMQKIFQRILINGFSFLTESGRILEGELIREGGVLKNSTSKGGLI